MTAVLPPAPLARPPGAPPLVPHLRQFADRASGALSYLVACPRTGQALMIDPVFDDALLYLGVVEEMGWRLAYILETHLHSDRRSAAAVVQSATRAVVGVSRQCGPAPGDLVLEGGSLLALGELVLEILATPGHTAGCLSFRLADRLFTGDCLGLGDGGGTDEPDSDPARLFDSVRRHFLPLADEILIYPGRLAGERRIGCIGEERGRNPLFAGQSRDEFVSRRNAGRRPLPAESAAVIAANRRGPGAPASLAKRI